MKFGIMNTITQKKRDEKFSAFLQMLDNDKKTYAELKLIDLYKMKRTCEIQINTGYLSIDSVIQIFSISITILALVISINYYASVDLMEHDGYMNFAQKRIEILTETKDSVREINQELLKKDVEEDETDFYKLSNLTASFNSQTGMNFAYYITDEGIGELSNLLEDLEREMTNNKYGQQYIGKVKKIENNVLKMKGIDLEFEKEIVKPKWLKEFILLFEKIMWLILGVIGIMILLGSPIKDMRQKKLYLNQTKLNYIMLAIIEKEAQYNNGCNEKELIYEDEAYKIEAS